MLVIVGKFAEIRKDFIRIAHDIMLFAFFDENSVQLFAVFAWTFIGIAVFSYVPLLHPGEMFVKGRVEVLSVAVSYRCSHTEIYNTLDACVKAVRKDTPQVFFGIVYIRQYRTKPHDGWDSALSALFRARL